MALIIPNNIANGQDADGDLVDQNFDVVASYVNTEVIRRDGQVAMTAPLALSGPPTAPNQAATKAYVDASGPIGSVMMFAGDVEPTGYLFCRGQAVPRTTYAALFAVIGIRFGAGDGTTTFNLPNYQGTAPVGHNTGTNSPANVPATAWVAGVGERGGYADSQLPTHAHITGNHVHDLNNHTHAVNIGTSGHSNDHVHVMPQELAKYNPFVPSHTLDIWDGGPSITVDFAGGAVSSGTNADHTHNVNGNTGVPNGGFTTGFSAPATDAQGVAATNRNYSPALTLNFLIKF